MYKYLFFDLDGTLVDSGEGIMRCAQYALKAFGVEESDWRTLRGFVGPPLEDSFKEFYGFNSDDARQAVLVYRERYFAKGVYEQKPYDGVFEFLAEIKRRGYIVALATSKMQRQAEFVTKELFPEFANYIDYVFARDNEGVRHTKGDVIRHALSVLDLPDTSEILMIGDRKFDINGAHECGLTAMGVLYGFGDLAEMQEARADYICTSFDDILLKLSELH